MKRTLIYYIFLSVFISLYCIRNVYGGTITPTDAAETYLNAIIGHNYTYAVKLIHPDSLQDIRNELIKDVLSERSIDKKEKDTVISNIKSLNEEELFLAYIKLFPETVKAIKELAEASEIKIVGEKKGLRNRATVYYKILNSSKESFSLKRHEIDLEKFNSDWRVVLVKQRKFLGKLVAIGIVESAMLSRKAEKVVNRQIEDKVRELGRAVDGAIRETYDINRFLGR